MKHATIRVRTIGNLNILLAFISLPVYSGNYVTCLLEKLPEVQNDVAAHSVGQLCIKEYPGGYSAVEQGSGRGLFTEYSSGAECTIDKAKESRSYRASVMIATACHHLYDEPIKPWEEYKSIHQSFMPRSNDDPKHKSCELCRDGVAVTQLIRSL